MKTGSKSHAFTCESGKYLMNTTLPAYMTQKKSAAAKGFINKAINQLSIPPL